MTIDLTWRGVLPRQVTILQLAKQNVLPDALLT